MARPNLELAAQTDTVLTTEGLRTYLDGVRQIDLFLADCLHEAAGILRFGIRSMHEPESNAIARKVTRPIDHAAALHEQGARSLTLAWTRAGNLLIPENTVAGRSSKTFDRKK